MSSFFGESLHIVEPISKVFRIKNKFGFEFEFTF
jgi:hypothetical protein